MTRSVQKSLAVDTPLRAYVVADDIGDFLESPKGKPADIHGA